MQPGWLAWQQAANRDVAHLLVRSNKNVLLGGGLRLAAPSLTEVVPDILGWLDLSPPLALAVEVSVVEKIHYCDFLT